MKMSKNENIPIMSTYAHLNRFVSTHRWKHFNADNAAACRLCHSNEQKLQLRWEKVRALGIRVISCVQHFVSYDIIWCYHWLDPAQNFILLLFSTWNPKCWENNILIIAIVTTDMMFSNAKAGSSLLYNGPLYNSIGYNFFSFYKK